MAKLLAVSPRVSSVNLRRNHFNWHCIGELIISVTIQKLAPTSQGQNTDGPVNQRFLSVSSVVSLQECSSTIPADAASVHPSTQTLRSQKSLGTIIPWSQVDEMIIYCSIYIFFEDKHKLEKKKPAVL